MKFKEYFIRSKYNTSTTNNNLGILGLFRFGSGYALSAANSMKLATTWRCVNLLSDSVASLPLYPYIFKEN